MRYVAVVLILIVAGCGNPSGGGPKVVVETLRPLGIFQSHDAQLIGQDASTVTSPINMSLRKETPPHFLNYCSPLSPEGVESAAASAAGGGALDVSAPGLPVQGKVEGYGSQSGTRIVFPRPWHKTQSVILFESYRFALCEAWRNNQLDNDARKNQIIDLLTTAYVNALKYSDAEIRSEGWANRNEGMTVQITSPTAPTLPQQELHPPKFNDTPIPVPVPEELPAPPKKDQQAPETSQPQG
jgi:hypothetical protein